MIQINRFDIACHFLTIFKIPYEQRRELGLVNNYTHGLDLIQIATWWIKTDPEIARNYNFCTTPARTIKATAA